MKPKFIAITSAVCVFAYSLYEAPSENDVSNNVSGALSTAAKFSSNIRRGLKQSLRSAASGAAEERLELDAMPSFSDVAIWSELSRTNVIPPMHHYLWTPAVANFERPSDSVELMRLERRGNFYTMTFRGLVDDWSSTTVI